MIEPTPPVAILMGSQSDWATLRHAADTLDSLGIGHDDRIISAHRTPDRLITFCKGARRAGYKIIIAGAGGAAHLPGMAAAMTPLPVFGVPVESKALGGVDSLLLDRADAGRGPCRNSGDRTFRRDQCGAPCRRGARPHRRRGGEPARQLAGRAVRRRRRAPERR